MSREKTREIFFCRVQAAQCVTHKSELLLVPVVYKMQGTSDMFRQMLRNGILKARRVESRTAKVQRS